MKKKITLQQLSVKSFMIEEVNSIKGKGSRETYIDPCKSLHNRGACPHEQ
ncbi:MAG: hypothetical protein WBH03_04925 [Cyclobacteriaceae bacterium]